MTKALFAQLSPRQARRFAERTRVLMPEFPKTVVALAQLLSDDHHGSEKFIAEMVLGDTPKNAGWIGATFAWLACLAQSIDVDRAAKSPEIRKYAKVALGDLAQAIIKGSEKELQFKELRAQQKNSTSLMLLIEIGAPGF